VVYITLCFLFVKYGTNAILSHNSMDLTDFLLFVIWQMMRNLIPSVYEDNHTPSDALLSNDSGLASSLYFLYQIETFLTLYFHIVVLVLVSISFDNDDHRGLSERTLC
jgi:hypothetical protein